MSKNSENSLKIVEDIQPNLILLDIMIPNLSGFEICKTLQEDKHTKDIPIIFLTALDDINEKIKGFKIGGSDYITKPFNKVEVLARINTHLYKYFLIESLKDTIMQSYHELLTPISVIETGVELQLLKPCETKYLKNIILQEN